MPLAELHNIGRTRPSAEPSARFARRGTRFARGVLVGGIAAFSALAAMVPTRRGETLDRAITARIQAREDPRIERAAAAVSWFGFRPQSRVLPLVYAAVLWIARFRLEAVFQLAASGTGLLATIVKSFMRRPRPAAGKDLRVVTARLRGSSLPSGHVLTYVGVYGWMAIMAHVLIKPRLLRRLAVGALTTLVAAVGPSRIYLGHHWPSDVFASYLLGSSYLAGLVVAYRRLRSRSMVR
jgi:membrane-associated phospholipid phosphatase